MNIAVVGYYGFGNFGDELFLQVFRQLFPGDGVYAWTPYHDINQVDRVIIGGGDLIIPHQYQKVYFPPWLTNKPTVIYGVGVVDAYPPEKWPEAEVAKYREALGRTRGVFVRSEQSARLLRTKAIYPRPEVVPDLAFAYRQPTLPFTRASHLPTCGIVVANYPDFPRPLVEELARWLLDQGWFVLFIPVVEHPTNLFADRELCHQLLASVKKGRPNPQADITPETYSLEHVYCRLQNLDCLISCKLHPALASLRAGVPVLSLSDQHKLKDLMAQFGLGEFALPLKPDAKVAIASLKRLTLQRVQLKPPILAKASELEQASQPATRRLVDLVRQ